MQQQAHYTTRITAQTCNKKIKCGVIVQILGQVVSSIHFSWYPIKHNM